MNENEMEKPANSETVFEDFTGSAGSGYARNGKKNLTLVMLVIAAVTGLAAILARRGPQSAAAAPNPPPASVAVLDTRQPTVASTQPDRSAAATDNLVAKLRFAPADVQVPVADLKADPFQAKGSSGHAVQLPDDAAETQRREQERQAALDAVQSLQLQAIRHDDSHHTCTINDALYQEGQEVDGFTVEQIAASTVVVRKGVYRFELRVQ